MPTSEEYQHNIAAMGWDELYQLWLSILSGEFSPTDWEPGKAFEYLVIRAFEVDHAEVKYPYTVKVSDEVVEELDGVVYTHGLSFLIESKDTQKPVNVEPIAKLRNQLSRRPSATIGVLFSRSGFTEPAKLLVNYTSPQTILLWEGIELEFALEQQNMCDNLLAKYRYSVEYGIPSFNIRGGTVK